MATTLNSLVDEVDIVSTRDENDLRDGSVKVNTWTEMIDGSPREFRSASITWPSALVEAALADKTTFGTNDDAPISSFPEVPFGYEMHDRRTSEDQPVRESRQAWGYTDDAFDRHIPLEWTTEEYESVVATKDGLVCTQEVLIDMIERVGPLQKLINVKGVSTIVFFEKIHIDVENDPTKSGLFVRTVKSDKMLKNPDLLQFVFTHPPEKVSCSIKYDSDYHVKNNVAKFIVRVVSSTPEPVSTGPNARRHLSRLAAHSKQFISEKLAKPELVEFHLPPKR